MRSYVAAWLGLDPDGIWSLLVSQPAALGLGFVVSVAVVVLLARRAGFGRRASAELLIAAYVGALGVGRLLDVVSWGPAFWQQPWRLFDPWFGGASTLGGLVGATLGVLVFARRRGQDGLAFLDAIAPTAGLTVAFFKLGCLLAGCCFGARTTGALGVRFPASAMVYYHQRAAGLIDQHYSASLPVHPAQAYEAAWGLCVFGALMLLREPLLARRGASLWWGATLLLLGRLVVEHFRGTPEPTLLGLRGAQWTCLGGLLLLGLLLHGPTRARALNWLAPPVLSPPASP